MFMTGIHLQLSVVLAFHCVLVIETMADGGGHSSSAVGLVVSPTTSSVVSTGSVQAKGRPRRSVVWDYFEYEEVTNQSVCQILQCGDSDESDVIAVSPESSPPI